MVTSELSEMIAWLLLQQLPEGKRNISTCEKILNDALRILKGITLSS